MYQGNKKGKQVLGLTLALALLGTGCGGSAYRSGNEAADINNGKGSSTNPGGNNNVTPITPTTPMTPDSSTSKYLPTATYSFSINGQGGAAPSSTTPEVFTSTILKVTVTSGGPNNSTVPGGTYTNFAKNYGCISYEIAVLNADGQKLGGSVDTGVLSLGGNNALCPNSPKSITIDLSDRLTSGHDALRVQVSNPKHDYKCQMWHSCQANGGWFWSATAGWYYDGVCASSFSYYQGNNYCASLRDPGAPNVLPAFKNDTVTGTLAIETNGSLNK